MGGSGRQVWLYSLILVVSVLLASPEKGWSQVTAAISGRVEDTSGAAVSGAKVTVTNMETGAKREVTTDSLGSYRVLSLEVGLHELKVENSGFGTAVWTGIRLSVGEERVENIRLVVSQAVEQVTVTAQAPVVNVTTAPVTGLVGEREVKDLPLNGRSFDDLITLNPGATNFTSMRSPNTTTSNGNAFSVDGQKPGDNETLLNGVEYTGSSQLAVTPGGVSGYLLGIDAVREFNLLTGTYGAEYGKRSGAQVDVVTQSGSNALHGTVYEFLRNNVLDTRNYFDQGSTQPFKQNQFGAAMGGPIKKDKLFLFGNYEGFRQRLSVTSVSFVPDAATIAATSPAMQKYLALWPTPGPGDVDLGGGTEKVFRNPKQSINEDFGTLKLDYNLGRRDTLSAAYTIDDGNSLIPQADPLFASALAVGSQVLSVQETHIFSPRIVNMFTVGFSRAAFANDSAPYVSFPADLAFVPGLGPGGIVVGGGLTTTGSGVITSAGPNNASNVRNRRNLFTYADNLQISKGIHQISVGVSFQRLQDNEDTASRQLGQASFASLATFEAGTVSSFQVVRKATELGWRSLIGAWYVEDAIKLRHNLTVEVGLRHEFDTGWNEEAGRASNYLPDPSTGILQTTPAVGSSVFTQNNAKWLFGPRVAVAWDLFGHGNTVVHAGFGMYYSLLDALAFQLNSVAPYNGSISYTGNLATITGVDLTEPIAAQCILGAAPTTPPCIKYAPQGVQANAKTPTVEKWNLAIEQQLTRTTSLRIGYVGSFGYHQVISEDPNTIPPQICSTTPTCTAGGVASSGIPAAVTAQSAVPVGATYIPVGTRPNPELGAGFFWYTRGTSSYNALQLDVTKRFTRGLQFRANYTWSKSLDINSAPTGAQANNEAQMVLDRFDLRKDWGPSALNVAQQVHLMGSYELPFGRGRYWLANVHGAGDKLVSGWTLNTITTLASGFPLTPQDGSNRSGDGDTRNPDRPSVSPSFSGSVIEGSPTQWFNPNAYVLPAAGTFGNLGRGTLRGPGLVGMDVSLFKDTKLTEKVAMQFRAECFNMLNHTNFNTPNLTVFSGAAISPTAGQISATATPSRQIQFGLKMIY